METSAAEPSSWMYEIDPAFAADGRVPPTAIRRAAPQDKNGKIIGPWQNNPKYSPSVLAQLIEIDPTDQFLVRFGAYLRGAISRVEFGRHFAQTSFWVLSDAEQKTIPLIECEGKTAYLIFSSQTFLNADRTPAVVLPGADLIRFWGNCEGFLLNSGTQGSLWLPINEVRTADDSNSL